MPHYDTPDNSVTDLLDKVKEQYHPELIEAQVTTEVLFAYDDKGGFPVKFGGYPALAVVKINNLKNRAKGFADIEIIVDGEAYKSLTEPQRIAVWDHELYHVVVKRDKEGNIKTDDLNRPKLSVKKHDYQLGWFREIAERHGSNSPEVYQASILWHKDGRTFFPSI